MTAITLKQKLLKSRQLWKEMYDAEFLADLYEVLDCTMNDEVISWSEDGRVVLVRKSKEIEEKILPYIANCNTLKSFLSKLKQMKFIQLTNTSYEAELVFQHAYYSQENRPVFESFEESREKKRGSKAGWTQGPLEEISSVPKKIKYSDPQPSRGSAYPPIDSKQYQSLQTYCEMLALRKTLQEAFQILNVEEDLRRYSFAD